MSNEDTGSNVTLSFDTHTVAEIGAPGFASTMHAAVVGYAERRCLQAHVVNVGGTLCGWLTIRLHRTRSSRGVQGYTAAASSILRRVRRDLSSLISAHGEHVVIVRLPVAGTAASKFRSVITGAFINRFMGDGTTLGPDGAGDAHWTERVCVTAVNTTVPWAKYGTFAARFAALQGTRHHRMAIIQG